jgi:hypothetical protein
MARGLKQQQQQQGWKEETSINTYTHTCKHALSLSTSLHLQLPQKPLQMNMCISRKEMQSGAGNKCGSGLWPNPKKSTGNKKKRKHDPGEDKNFIHLHQKKKCDADHRAPQLLTVWERILPPLSSKLEAVKKHQGSPIEVLRRTHDWRCKKASGREQSRVKSKR